MLISLEKMRLFGLCVERERERERERRGHLNSGLRGRQHHRHPWSVGLFLHLLLALERDPCSQQRDRSIIDFLPPPPPLRELVCISASERDGDGGVTSKNSNYFTSNPSSKRRRRRRRLAYNCYRSDFRTSATLRKNSASRRVHVA